MKELCQPHEGHRNINNDNTTTRTTLAPSEIQNNIKLLLITFKIIN